MSHLRDSQRRRRRRCGYCGCTSTNFVRKCCEAGHEVDVRKAKKPGKDRKASRIRAQTDKLITQWNAENARHLKRCRTIVGKLEKIRERCSHPTIVGDCCADCQKALEL
jgi:hypothetical protein